MFQRKYSVQLVLTERHNFFIRARCPSILELNVPRVDFSSIAIELTFVTLGHGFKKAGSVLFDIGDVWDKDFINPITSVCICIIGWCYGCV